MPFIFPKPLPDKNLTENTTQAYKHLLNQISKVEYIVYHKKVNKETKEVTVEYTYNPINNILLLQHYHREVIDYINNLEEPNSDKRRYCSAIFWILHDTDFLTPDNPYRIYNNSEISRFIDDNGPYTCVKEKGKWEKKYKKKEETEEEEKEEIVPSE